MTIPAEILEELATGKRNALEPHPYNSGEYRPMIRADVDGLVKALKSNPNIESIDLHHMSVGTDWLIEIAHALRGNTSLKTLTLSVNNMSDDAAAAFSSVLKNHPTFEDFQCAGNPMLSDVGIGQLAHSLGTCKNLRSVNFNTNPIGNGGAAAIGQMMRKSPNLEKLNVASCGIDKDPGKAVHIASAIPFCPKLFMLHVADTGVPQGQNVADACEGIVNTDTNPNLFTVSPNGSHLSRLARQNDLYAEAAFRPIERGINQLSTMKTVHLARIEPLQPILSNIGYRASIKVDSAKLATAKAYLQSPPEIDITSLTLESLTAQDDNGFTPLDHPLTWRRIGEIATALEANDTPLTQNFLNGRNSRGESWLECGLASAPEKLIPVLNNRGIQLRAEDLIFQNAKGETVTKLPLDAVLASGKVETLFTLDNLRGASQQELSRLYDAVPEAAQTRIGNFTALRQQIRAAASSSQGIGR